MNIRQLLLKPTIKVKFEIVTANKLDTLNAVVKNEICVNKMWNKNSIKRRIFFDGILSSYSGTLKKKIQCDQLRQ